MNDELKAKLAEQALAIHKACAIRGVSLSDVIESLSGERDDTHRIEVDSCGGCPFNHWIPHQDFCAHPAVKTSGGASKMLPQRRLDPPPEWCPLRGAVTIIAGPS